MAPGQGPGLSLRDLGESAGSEATSLIASEMPSHSHVAAATADTAVTNAPADAYLARPLGRGSNLYSPSATGTTSMAPTSIAGGGQPHNNMQPYLVINFCIALQGIFPSRN